jgi:hypothetical protein
MGPEPIADYDGLLGIANRPGTEHEPIRVPTRSFNQQDPTLRIRAQECIGEGFLITLNRRQIVPVKLQD